MRGVGLAILCTVLSLAARAQGAPPAPPQGRDQAPKKRVLKLDAFTVEGRIQKPQAFFILQRSSQGFEASEKKESFLPKILKSCEKEPF